MLNASRAYKQTQVTTTNQGDIVVMLYDGALKFLNRAMEGLAENDMAKKGIAISKALDIINEMDGVLNLQKGGELAKNLHGLYMFCSNHLVKANIKKDVKMVQEVVKILSGLRSAYAEIVNLPEAQAAAQEAATYIRADTSTPSRSQPGTTGTGTPMPGAAKRQRDLYARQAALQANALPDAQTGSTDTVPPAEGLANAPGTAEPSSAAAPAAAASTASPAADGQQEKTGAPEAPKSTEKEGTPEAFQAGFGATAGFMGKRSGANLYRKFSGQ